MADTEEKETCPICLDGYDDMLKTLDCEHHFHRDCIDKWLLTHISCPVCRRLANGFCTIRFMGRRRAPISRIFDQVQAYARTMWLNGRLDQPGIIRFSDDSIQIEYAPNEFDDCCNCWSNRPSRPTKLKLGVPSSTKNTELPIARQWLQFNQVIVIAARRPYHRSTIEMYALDCISVDNAGAIFQHMTSTYRVQPGPGHQPD